MIILNKRFVHEAQDFEMFIKYDEVEKTPLEVKNIMLHTHGNWFPVGNIITKFFKDAVWALITETNWEEVRAEMEGNTLNLSHTLHPVFEQALRPFLIIGEEVKETYN